MTCSLVHKTRCSNGLALGSEIRVEAVEASTQHSMSSLPAAVTGGRIVTFPLTGAASITELSHGPAQRKKH